MKTSNKIFDLRVDMREETGEDLSINYRVSACDNQWRIFWYYAKNETEAKEIARKMKTHENQTAYESLFNIVKVELTKEIVFNKDRRN